MFGPIVLVRAIRASFRLAVLIALFARPIPVLAKSTCDANETVPMTLAPGTKVFGNSGMPRGAIGGQPTQIEGGTATMTLGGATFVAGSGTQFYLTCYVSSDPSRGLIPMFALAFGTITVSAPANATGEFGVLTSRLAAIAKAGSTWSMSWTGETATLAVRGGPPIEGAAATVLGGHASLTRVPAGHWITVGPNQFVTMH